MKPTTTFPTLSGIKLREARIAAGMRQAELARRIGTRPKMISQYEHAEGEKGYIQPKVNRVLAICAVLGCRVEDLCEGGTN